MEPESDAVRLDEVQIRVGGRTILGPISLTIGVGERWALLGPNGSGKSTLLSVAGAWRHPSSGRAWVLGERLGATDVRELRRRIGHGGFAVTERLRIGITADDAVLAGRAAALETWFRDFDERDRAAAAARLAEVGCADLADRRLATCSQGERARVVLARALVADPDLLLLDEPAAGLDLPGRERLLSALSEATQGGAPPTLILATHHLEELPPTVTHAALLRGGRLLTSGSVEEALTSASLSECFGIGIEVRRAGGRWSAVATADR
jgi:iron complex transport system ATP-binding protein